MWRSHQLLDLPDNDIVLNAVKKHPERLLGFAFINPGHPDAIAEARKCLDAGMQGLKFALLQYPAPIDGPVEVFGH